MATQGVFYRDSLIRTNDKLFTRKDTMRTRKPRQKIRNTSLLSECHTTGERGIHSHADVLRLGLGSAIDLPRIAKDLQENQR